MAILSEEEKSAILAAIQPSIDSLIEAVYTAASALKPEVVEPTDPVEPTEPVEPTDPVEPVEPSEPEEPQEPQEPETPVIPPVVIPSSKTPFTIEVTGYSNKVLTVSADQGLVKDTTIITLGNTQSVNVLDVQPATDPSLYLVTIDQDVTAAAVVGKEATVKDRYSDPEQPVIEPTQPDEPEAPVEPAQPEEPTAPVVTAPAVSVALINNLTGGDWVNGTWQSTDSGGISLVTTDEVAATFVVGAEVTFSDNSKRAIFNVTPNGNYYNIWFGARKLDSSLGYPNTVSAPKIASSTPAAPVDSTPVVSAPAVDPVVSATPGNIFVNLGMGAGGDTVLPGTAGTNYGFASETEIKRAVGYGFKRFRVGFLWERAIQPGGTSFLYTGAVNGNPSTIEEIKRVAKTAWANGAQILVDMHNYAGYSATGTSQDRKIIGSAGGPTAQQWANDWKAIILALKADADAWKGIYGFDTMNEWQSISYAVVKDAAQKFLDTCGPIMDQKIAMFEGINFSSTVDWVANNPDYFTVLKDPRGKGYIEFSGHLYLDQAASGYYNGDTVSDGDKAKGITTSNIFEQRLASAMKAAQAAGVKFSIGECNVPGNLTNLLVGLKNGLAVAKKAGIDVYCFGMSDWFGDNLHNIELAVNKPTLKIFQDAM